MAWFGDGSGECFPARGEGMSLSTVDKPDPYRKAKARRADEVIGLKTTDIVGAQTGTTPRARRQRFTNKVSYGVNASDIEGASPPRLIPQDVDPVRRPNNRIVSNHDIEYSQPRPKTFRTTRSTNPLNPDYTLPDVADRPVTPPKFVRDSFNVSDIEGTRSKPLYRRTVERDPLAVSDIAGTTVGWKPEYKRRTSTSKALETGDINNDGIFKTKRCTNPMEPTYTYDVSDEVEGPSFMIGDIPGSHPKGSPTTAPRLPFSLRTDDIPDMKDREGHKVPRSFPKEAQRRDFRKINNLEDIDGAQPSHKRSTFYRETQRITNPLNPQYVELDGPVHASSVASTVTRSQHSGAPPSTSASSSWVVVEGPPSTPGAAPSSHASRPPSSVVSSSSRSRRSGSAAHAATPSVLSPQHSRVSRPSSRASSVASSSGSFLSYSRPKNAPGSVSSSSRPAMVPPLKQSAAEQRREDIESVKSLPK